MRQIVSLPAERAALFADYLLTLGIETRLDPDGPASIIWICDEDKLPRARTELEAFQADPGAARYRTARVKAARLRQDEQEVEEDYREQNEQFREEMDHAGQAPQIILTALLVVLSVGAFTAKRSDEANDPIYKAFRIDSGEKVEYRWATTSGGNVVEVPDRLFADVRATQVWRILTPALLHFGLAHLVTNVFSMLYFGGTLESRLGSGRFLTLVLILAAASNTAQYLLGGGFATEDGQTVLVTNSHFGGLSGVLYGLFGYLWFKSRYRPAMELDLPPSVVTIMMVWFLLCWVGALGPIANVAHTAGLITGVLLAALPDPKLHPDDAS